MTPLQQLEAKIFLSNPELKQLGVGCEIKMYDENYTCIAIIDNEVYYESDLGIETADVSYIQDNETDCTIIGKPPTLVDVLKWMFSLKNKDFDFNLHSHSTELRIGENNPFGYDFAWNLNSIYLRDQSPELINFLINLNK